MVSTPDGSKYQQNRVILWHRVIPGEKLPLPPKATNVNIGAPIQVWIPQLSKCDNTQVHPSRELIMIKVAHPKAHP